jgi:hypothetical protein
MNREPDSWKIKGFQSNNETQATGNVIRVSSLDRTPNAFPGVGCQLNAIVETQGVSVGKESVL